MEVDCDYIEDFVSYNFDQPTTIGALGDTLVYLNPAKGFTILTISNILSKTIFTDIPKECRFGLCKERLQILVASSKPYGQNGPPVHGESSTSDSNKILGGILVLGGGIGMFLGIPGSTNVCSSGMAILGFEHTKDLINRVKKDEVTQNE